MGQGKAQDVPSNPQGSRWAPGAHPEHFPSSTGPGDAPAVVRATAAPRQLLLAGERCSEPQPQLRVLPAQLHRAAAPERVWSCPRESAAARDHQARKTSPIPLVIPTVNHSRTAQGTAQPAASSAPTCSWWGSVGIRSWRFVLGWVWGFVCAQGTAGRVRAAHSHLLGVGIPYPYSYFISHIPYPSEQHSSPLHGSRWYEITRGHIPSWLLQNLTVSWPEPSRDPTKCCEV